MYIFCSSYLSFTPLRPNVVKASPFEKKAIIREKICKN